jgi:type I restriction enzyme, R subunit
MAKVGEQERRTQNRVVGLFRDSLKYDYLGNWKDRAGNSNLEEDLLTAWLTRRKVPGPLMNRALELFRKAVRDTSKGLYDRNRDVYSLLRYGVKTKADVSDNTETVWLIDWKNPGNNDFAIAEEVTVEGATTHAYTKRPDIVLYVNGIALGVLELKRSTVSVAEGIRQNLDNQKKEFIQPFFSTMQYVMAGNNTEGLRYGTIETPERFYLTWKEPGGTGDTPLETALLQVCEKGRFLELIHDFIVFDRGVKKLSRPNQYFGVRAARKHVREREPGIIWHTQGSGKSLTMVWLAKWIRENVTDARVVIITDRTELDDQIEKNFLGVGEEIYRTSSGADLIAALNASSPWLICSLVHKFGRKGGPDSEPDRPDSDEASTEEVAGFIDQIKKSLPPGFRAKGDVYVFVDECHRTQSGDLHKAMKAILPEAMFIGFTGTPLLKADKQKSIEVFGKYIHTYKFDEAVQDGVVLDLRYEARDIDQSLTSQDKIDQWFEANTRGLNDLAKAELKKRWGTLQKVLSCSDRLERIVSDILMDMAMKDRLKSGSGNAMLVAGSIYEACRFYELFCQAGFKGKCAVVTSYVPNAAAIRGEETGHGKTEALRQYDIYKQMLANWFNEPADKAVSRIEEFETQVKKKFIDEPGQMKLLIVVDKLLTGFDAPPATFLYIDKEMRDHGLFQAICRVNRLDSDDKEFGYVVDYKDLFKSLEQAVSDYTSGALDGYEKEDVEGLLKDRVKKGREQLDETREALKALCEPVAPPRESAEYIRYFCAAESGNAGQLKENEPKRLALYKHVAAFIRAYANLANELDVAGYSAADQTALKDEAGLFEKVRQEVKLASGDYIDLKTYEPAMRHLIDTYIRADDSTVLSEFDDVSLLQVLARDGASGIGKLPKGIQKNKDAVAEVIENNVRKVIIDEQPINPKYYDRMSELLDALIDRRRKKAMEYQEYLREIVALAKQVTKPETSTAYPSSLATPALRALYDNLSQDETLARAVDKAIREHAPDDWRATRMKTLTVRNAIEPVVSGSGHDVDELLELVKNQAEY